MGIHPSDIEEDVVLMKGFKRLKAGLLNQLAELFFPELYTLWRMYLPSYSLVPGNHSGMSSVQVVAVSRLWIGFKPRSGRHLGNVRVIGFGHRRVFNNHLYVSVISHPVEVELDVVWKQRCINTPEVSLNFGLIFARRLSDPEVADSGMVIDGRLAGFLFCSLVLFQCLERALFRSNFFKSHLDYFLILEATLGQASQRYFSIKSDSVSFKNIKESIIKFVPRFSSTTRTDTGCLLLNVTVDEMLMKIHGSLSLMCHLQIDSGRVLVISVTMALSLAHLVRPILGVVSDTVPLRC
ncbi:hypothetical protein Tco_0850635 [Tanacetum coccineum]